MTTQLEPRVLPVKVWPLIAPDMAAQFGNGMPLPGRAEFVGVMDGDKLAGYCMVERTFHAHCLRVMPEYQGARLALKLARAVLARIPSGYPVIVLTDLDAAEQTPAGLLPRMGGRDCGVWRLWRKDIPLGATNG